MFVFQNKETGEIIDPRTQDFALSPADLLPEAESWDEVFEQNIETDLIDGFAAVEK